MSDTSIRPTALHDVAEKEEFAADIYLVLHEDLRRSAKIRAVADFLGEVLAERAG